MKMNFNAETQRTQSGAERKKFSANLRVLRASAFKQ
jgi:hypothetical protein